MNPSRRLTARGVALAVGAAALAVSSAASADTTADTTAGQQPSVDRAFAEAAAEAGTAPTVDQLPPFVLDAHRGGGLEARENSLSGIQHALDSGVVDVVDLDVRRLGDGTLGVMHDGTVDRVTSSTGPTASYDRESWDALSLDIGWWLTPAPQPEAPPTLAEVLRRFGDDTVLTVEVKEGLLDEVAQLLRDQGLTGSVLVNSNDPGVARAVHDLGMRAHLWRTPAQMHTDAPAAWARWLDVVDVDVHAARADIRKFVTSGIPRVWTHTVSTRAQRDRAVRLGVDGIVTDDPRYLSGGTDVYPASPTVVQLRGRPAPVQVSDRTDALVSVSAESGTVLPGTRVTVATPTVTGRATVHPSPGLSAVRLSPVTKEATRVRFVVPGGAAGERRWPEGRATARLHVLGEDLQLVPSVQVTGRHLSLSVRLLDSAARGYVGPRAEWGTGTATPAGVDRAGLRVRVYHHGEVVHRERTDGAGTRTGTSTGGDRTGSVTFAPWVAPGPGRYRVRLAQRGPVYRHLVVERRVRVD